jgi:hypothetical protein
VVGATTTHSCDAGRKFSFDFIINERKSDGSCDRSCDSRSILTRSISLTQAICVPSPSVTSIHPPRQYNKKINKSEGMGGVSQSCEACGSRTWRSFVNLRPLIPPL